MISETYVTTMHDHDECRFLLRTRRDTGRRQHDAQALGERRAAVHAGDHADQRDADLDRRQECRRIFEQREGGLRARPALFGEACSRERLAETSAISDSAKNPFNKQQQQDDEDFTPEHAWPIRAIDAERRAGCTTTRVGGDGRCFIVCAAGGFRQLSPTWRASQPDSGAVRLCIMRRSFRRRAFRNAASPPISTGR